MIYTFWEGRRPAYIDLCMHTWKFPFTVLNYSNLSEYTELPVEKLKRFTLPQVADCVRVHVLRDHGGHWLDADTISITGQLPSVTLLGNPDVRTNTIGMLHAEPHDEMFVQWAEYQDEIINRSDTPQHWGIMGNLFTDKYLAEHRDVPIGSISNRWPETYMIGGAIPRSAKYQKFYFESSYQLKDIRQTDLLMLHNSWTPVWYKWLTEKEVLERKCTLSNILGELL